MQLAMPRVLIVLVLLQVCSGTRSIKADDRSLNFDGPSPVRRVVTLLKEMQKQVEAEIKEDENVYGKMECWCTTNDREKTAAIATAEQRIGELGAAIEEGTATAAQLTSEIAGLKDDIQANQDAIDTASALREKEKAEFEDEEKEMMDTLAALKEAIGILAKVQLAQKSSGHQQIPEASLVQLRHLATRLSKSAPILLDKASEKKSVGVYKAVMQKDLWDLLSTMSSDGGSGDSRVITSLGQQPTGAAAGATSYSARSAGILGILKQMQATFSKDLATAQKEEIQAALAFERLRSAKEGEIMAQAKALQEREQRLADTNEKVAQAKVDLEETQAALTADQKFLMDLKERCSTAASEYDERQKTRREESLAISETIKILMEDDARDLFSKTISFLQTGVRRHQGKTVTQGTKKQRSLAAAQIMAVAKRHGRNAGGWRLATLAVRVQLDGFEKVKKVLDNMAAELKKQQAEEVEKHDSCKTDIDAVEDSIMVKNTEKKDTEALIGSLEATTEQLASELAELNAQVAEAHVTLKAAGEDRKAENHEFQQVVSDQRATAAILKKAMARLQSFYSAGSFLAISKRQEPGAPVAPPPPAGKEYSSAGAAPGVIQMLAKIIQDAERADAEAVAQEQASQQAYSELVANVNSILDGAATAITQKTIAKEKAHAEKLEAEKQLRAVSATLEDLAGQEQAYHLTCDFLLKNFDVRQKARQEEIDSIGEAKAILSGADFGSDSQ